MDEKRTQSIDAVPQCELMMKAVPLSSNADAEEAISAVGHVRIGARDGHNGAHVKLGDVQLQPPFQLIRSLQRLEQRVAAVGDHRLDEVGVRFPERTDNE